MSATPSKPKAKPRHPSAGNLDNRPSLVAEPKKDPLSPLAAFPVGAQLSPDVPRIAPAIEASVEEKLFGHLKGRRVLELGCGTGSNSVAMAKAGARVIAIDSSPQRLSDARQLAEAQGVKVEFHHGDLADLAFIRADEIDFALAAFSLAEIKDLSRVFRQVHRVIRSESSLLVSLPHPVTLALDQSDKIRPSLARNLFDDSVITWSHNGREGTIYPHRISDVVVALSRSNYRVDLLLEPQTAALNTDGVELPFADCAPPSFILRGRKEGT